MADTIITVRGEHSERFDAERAVVSASVHTDGPLRESVFARAVEASDAVRDIITSIHDADEGPIASWSSDSVRVWSERPWNNEGKQLAPVFHAAVDFAATFVEFDALARWVESAAAIDAVTIGGVSWDLTEETRARVSNEVRTKAVADAITKAVVYGAAVGLPRVTAVALADPGMLDDPSNGAPSPVFARASLKSQAYDSAAPQLALKPEQILVACAVDARFIATKAEKTKTKKK
jgi:uncharacterized protein YggE